MSLRNQIISILTVLTVVLVITTYSVQTHVILPAFEKLERQAAVADINRCTAAIDREVELLSLFCCDWSAWDDVYKFAADRNEEFIQSNLKDNAFEISHVNLICILNPQNEIVWGGFRDMETHQLLESGTLFEVLTQHQPLLNQFKDLEDSHAGLISTIQGPMLIAARPITTSLIEGPSRGTMIFGRLLNEAAVEELRSRTGIQLNTWNLAGGEVPTSIAEIVDAAKSDSITRIVDIDSLEVFRVVNDIFGNPLIMAQAQLPRPVMAQGRVATRFAAACTAIGGVLTMLILGVVLRWRITKPLQDMAGHALRVGSQSNLKARLSLTRGDEIGVLAKEFDVMVDNLDQSRKQLAESAHQAGMSEIASEMLHNIGNAVNSVNCSASQLEERLKGSKITGLRRSADLLRDQSDTQNLNNFFTSDSRGPKLVQYLIDLTAVMEQERTENQEEVSRLRETARHISDIIAAQQSYANRSDFRHEVNLNQVVNELLTINQELIRALEVQVELDVPELPELMLNKSKLTQVLVNLIRNSIQAMQAQPSDNRKLKLACQVVNENDLEIEVTDSGIGFDQEIQSKLFTHGFTTKSTGNGLGLHYCANAIREIGGHIAAQSPGPGLGATFRIRIPNIFAKTVAAQAL